MKREKFTDDGVIVLDVATTARELVARLAESKWRRRKCVGAWVPLNFNWPIGTRVRITVQRAPSDSQRKG